MDGTKCRKVTEDASLQLKDIVLRAEHLLNTKYPNQSFSHFTKFYKSQLIGKGYASFSGRIYQSKLHDDFHTRYSQQLLKNLNVEIGNTDSWIASISRKHRKSFHPYYHTLILCLLGLDNDSVFKVNSMESHPFGKPNWPCLNVVCSKFHRNIIDEVNIRRCKKTKKPIGRFTCSICGFSYTRKGQDKEKVDKYRYTRVLHFGLVWKMELKKLLNEGLSYREVA